MTIPLFHSRLLRIGSILVLFSTTSLGAQSFDYSQYQSMLTMKDYFEDKVVNNQLYNAIEFVNPGSKPMPTFEGYHESNVWAIKEDDVWLGNLRTGGKLNFNTEDLFKTPSYLELFCLMDMNFVSEPSGNTPVIDVPFPYIMSTDTTAMEYLPGVSVQFGEALSPWFKASVAHSFFDTDQTSRYFSNLETITLIDVRNPGNGLYLQYFQSGDSINLTSRSASHYGLSGKVSWLNKWLAERLDTDDGRVFDTMELGQLITTYDSETVVTTHLGVRRLFGYFDFDYAVKDDSFPDTRTSWWRTGFQLKTDGSSRYSSCYQFMAQLRAGLTFKNIHDYRGIFVLPVNNDNYRGVGWYIEGTIQNPVRQTLDWFYVLLLGNLMVLQAIGGDSNGCQDTGDKLGKAISDIVDKEYANRYNSNFFDRITIGYEYNNPETLEIHPFILDQHHFYVYIDLFI